MLVEPRVLASPPPQSVGSRELEQMSTSAAQMDQADVFARDGFDVTGYINEMFPSGMHCLQIHSLDPVT